MTMLEDNVDVDTALPVDGSPLGDGDSLVDLFQQELQEVTETVTVFIKIASLERIGAAVKYRFPENSKVLQQIAEKVMRQTKDEAGRNLYIAMDTMIALCDGIYVKPEGMNDYVELDPQKLGYPVKFDERLASIVKLPDPESATARQVLRRVFGNNDMEILDHAERLNRWLKNKKADVESEMWQLGK